jgi:predicted ATPase
MRGAGCPESTVLEGIANLVAKSFLIPDRSPSSGRWALPETIRAYALEKLAESGDAEATARCRAMFCGDPLEPVGDARSQSLIADVVGEAPEMDNLRGAHQGLFPVRRPSAGRGLCAGVAAVVTPGPTS